MATSLLCSEVGHSPLDPSACGAPVSSVFLVTEKLGGGWVGVVGRLSNSRFLKTETREATFFPVGFHGGKVQDWFALHSSEPSLPRGTLATRRDKFECLIAFFTSPFKPFYLFTSFGVGGVGPGDSFMLGKHWTSETYPQSKGFEPHTSYNLHMDSLI